MKTDIKYNNIIARGGNGYLEFLNSDREVLYTAEIDKEMIPKVSKYFWVYYESASNIIGKTSKRDKQVSLRRLITNAIEKEKVKHKNNNPLDCTLSNLIVVNTKEKTPNAESNEEAGNTNSFNTNEDCFVCDKCIKNDVCKYTNKAKEMWNKDNDDIFKVNFSCEKFVNVA